ncbi:MAG: SDR family NAD(P)-dependent oxidoreductase [Maricaulaceae bacterium]
MESKAENNLPYALITGASSGIGEAMARYAAQEGFNVGLCARRVERLESIAHELKTQYHVQADVFVTDLSKVGAAANLLKRVEDLGRSVDVLVNNAGASVAPVFSHTDIERQKAFLELTVSTPVTLSHGVLPYMMQRDWGRIINISSIMALSSGGKGHTLYPAGKSFLLKMSQSMNAEMGSKNIHISAVLPGVVSTDFQVTNGGKPVAPSRFSQTAQQVAEEAWRRNERGVEIIVPGLSAKIGAAFLRYTPERLMRLLTRPVAAKYYEDNQ